MKTASDLSNSEREKNYYKKEQFNLRNYKSVLLRASCSGYHNFKPIFTKVFGKTELYGNRSYVF